MKEFAAALAIDDPNAELWWDYVTMVSIPLCFTRPQERRRKDWGLPGITRIVSALSRWILSYNLRTVIVSEKNDSGESSIVVSLKQHGIFQDSRDTLRNTINKDLVTPLIQESLLSAEHLGQAQMKAFVDKRLREAPESNQHLDLKSPIQKNKAKIFCSLYEVVQPSNGKQKLIKVDRKILQILMTAYRAGH